MYLQTNEKKNIWGKIYKKLKFQGKFIVFLITFLNISQKSSRGWVFVKHHEESKRIIIVISTV